MLMAVLGSTAPAVERCTAIEQELYETQVSDFCHSIITGRACRKVKWKLLECVLYSTRIETYVIRFGNRNTSRNKRVRRFLTIAYNRS